MSFWIAGAAVAGAVGGGLISSKGAKDAANIQAGAADRSSEVYRQNFEDTEARLDPYIQAGLPAIDRQQALLGLQGGEAQNAAQQAAFAGPGFEYTRDQIIGDVNRGASANRQLRGGNRLAALTDRLEGLYGQRQDTYFNQLGSQTGVGLGAASALGGVGQNAAAGQANAITQGGQAQAGGTIGAAQSYGGAFADIAGAVGYAGANRNQNPSGQTWSYGNQSGQGL